MKTTGILVIAVCAGLAASAYGLDFTVVNVIPFGMSSETGQNGEPNIAVNPNNPQQVLISSFGATPNPYWLSNNNSNWATWSQATSENHGDTSISWAGSGTLYAGLLINGGADIETKRSSPPNPPVAFANPNAPNPNPSLLSQQFAGTDPDQPWVTAFTTGGHDRVYVANNDLGRGVAGARTSASISFSLNAEAAGGGTWKDVQIENGTVAGADLAGVRVATAGDRVYGVFERRTGAGVLNASDPRGQVIVVRDDNMGNGTGAGTEFQALGATGSNVLGFNVNRDLPDSGVNFNSGGTHLGRERLGSDVSIAVDPRNPDRVYVAYTDVIKDPVDNIIKPRVHIDVSLSAGVGWSLDRDLEVNTALPALSVAANGTLGIEYTELKDGKLQTHMSTVSDTDFINNFSNRTNDVLARFTDNVPAGAGEPYIGDFQDLESVGNTFYGTFSASNDPKGDNFPKGVYFQRLFSDGVNNLTGFIGPSNSYDLDAPAISLDPYFFTVAVPEPATVVLLLIGCLVMTVVGWHKRGAVSSRAMIVS